MQQYTCCFCGKAISKNQSITSISVTVNWNRQESEQQDQQFFCHLDCFKKALKKEEFLYLEESNS